MLKLILEFNPEEQTQNATVHNSSQIKQTASKNNLAVATLAKSLENKQKLTVEVNDQQIRAILFYMVDYWGINSKTDYNDRKKEEKEKKGKKNKKGTKYQQMGLWDMKI